MHTLARWRWAAVPALCLAWITCADPAEPSPSGPASQTPDLSDLDQVCAWVAREADYFGTAWVDRYKARLAVLEKKKDRLGAAATHEMIADVLLRNGSNDEAVTHLERALAIRKQSNKRHLLNRVRRSLGIAHLRRGETDHCIDHHNPQRCLFPIEGEGVWANPEPAIRAQEHFRAYLEDRPEDADVRWLLNVAHMAEGTWPDEVPERWRISREQVTGTSEMKRFRPAAGGLGVDTFSVAGGAIMDDFDGDHLLDLVVSAMFYQGRSIKFFRNNGDGTFADWTARSGLDQHYGGLNMAHADFDNDGRLDIFVLRGAWLGTEYGQVRNGLLRQTEDGKFVDVTVEAGLDRAGPTQAGAWGDFDNDGDLDLYVGFENQPNQLFQNNGDGTFTDVAEARGATGGSGFTKGANWGDFDNDGDLDLYVSNLGGPNQLFRNDGERFAEIGADVEVAADKLQPPAPEPTYRRIPPAIVKKNLLGGRRSAGERTFATWFFDYDNDGWLDIFAGGYAATLDACVSDYLGKPSGGPRLQIYRNDAKGSFENVSQRLGIHRVRMPMGANYGDLNNDGFTDIYLGTGRPPYEFLVPNMLWENVGGERFVDATTVAGVGHLQKGHAIALGDLDNDGDQDLFAQMGGFYPADAFRDELFENPGHGHRWLTVLLRGTTSNHFGVGARVRADVVGPDGKRSIHATCGTGGSFGSSSLQVELGLGNSDHIETLIVEWPTSGTRQTFADVDLDQSVIVTEGQNELRPLARPAITLAR